MKQVLLALVAVAAGCGTRPCRDGTLFVSLDFDSVAAGADTLTFTVTTPQGSQTTPRAHHVGESHSTAEVDFTNYPTGQTVTVVVTGMVAGQMIGGAGQKTLAAGCDTLQISVTSGVGTFDLTMPQQDLTGFGPIDMAGDQASSGPIDLEPAADLANAVCNGTCMPQPTPFSYGFVPADGGCPPGFQAQQMEIAGPLTKGCDVSTPQAGGCSCTSTPICSVQIKSYGSGDTTCSGSSQTITLSGDACKSFSAPARVIVGNYATLSQTCDLPSGTATPKLNGTRATFCYADTFGCSGGQACIPSNAGKLNLIGDALAVCPNNYNKVPVPSSNKNWTGPINDMHTCACSCSLPNCAAHAQVNFVGSCSDPGSSSQGIGSTDGCFNITSGFTGVSPLESECTVSTTTSGTLDTGSQWTLCVQQ